MLENDDSPLKEASSVGKALVELREKLSTDLVFPDELYFVMTFPELWLVWRMKNDERWWTGEDLRKYKEFSVDKLINLRGRTAAISC